MKPEVCCAALSQILDIICNLQTIKELLTLTIFTFLLPLSKRALLWVAVPAQHQVVNKERASGAYRLSAFYLARMFGELPLLMVPPALYFVISYPMMGCSSAATFVQLLLLLLLNSVVAEVGTRPAASGAAGFSLQHSSRDGLRVLAHQLSDYRCFFLFFF